MDLLDVDVHKILEEDDYSSDSDFSSEEEKRQLDLEEHKDKVNVELMSEFS